MNRHKEANTERDIPTNIIKQFPNLFIEFLHKILICITLKVPPTHNQKCESQKSN